MSGYTRPLTSHGDFDSFNKAWSGPFFDSRSRSASWEPGRSPLVNDIPDLQTLAAYDLKGESFPDAYLTAIICQAQPHHSSRTLAHLTRSQLISHVDALVAWWKAAN